MKNLRLTHETLPEKILVRLSGELGHHEAMDAVRYLENLIDLQMPGMLEMDLSGLSFMDSSGIAVIMSAYRNVRDIGGRFAVSNIPEQAKKVLCAASVDKIVKIL